MTTDMASQALDPRPLRNRSSAAAAVLLALIVIGYSGVWRFGFTNLDDQAYVLENPHIEGFNADHLRWAFTSFEHAIWSPLVWISFMLDYEIGGRDASVYHLQNLFWHAGAAVLLFFTLSRMTGAYWRSALVAAVFGVHPVHVESVAWIAERKDVLSAAFFVLALAAYLAYTRRPSSLRYCAVAGAMALGLASKPSVVTLPFVLLLLDYWPLARLGSKAELGRRLVEKAPLFALSLLSSFITSSAARHTLVPLASVDLSTRIANAAWSYLRYLAAFVYPVDLAVYYPYPSASELGGARLMLAAALLIAVTAAVFHLRGRAPYAVTGWLWYLGMLVPMIGLVRFGDVARADRFLHLPSIGLAIVTVWGMADLLARWKIRRSVAAALGAAWVLTLSLATRIQASYWTDSTALYRRAIAVTGGAYLPHYNLGRALAVEGKLEEAVHHFESAIRSNPTNAEARVNLGLCLGQLGRREEALAAFDEAVRIDPRHASALNGRGIVHAQAGELDQAVREFERTLEVDPGFRDARSNLALAYMELGRRDDARRVLEEQVRRGEATEETLRMLRAVASP